MMNGRKRFAIGLYAASNSFSLLWRHKSLLIYSSITILANLLIQLILYNILNTTLGKHVGFLLGLQGLTKTLLVSSSWLEYIGIFGINFANIIFITFFNAGLIHHTIHILHHQKASIKESLFSCFSIIKNITIWALLITVIMELLQIMSIYAYDGIIIGTFNPFILLITILSIGWSLSTFFVISVITAEPIGILQAIRLSISMIKTVFIEFIGGEFWLGIIAIVSIAPIALLHILYASTTHAPIILIGTSYSIIGIMCILSTVHTIFRTMLYHYYNLPKEELMHLRYPRF